MLLLLLLLRPVVVVVVLSFCLSVLAGIEKTLRVYILYGVGIFVCGRPSIPRSIAPRYPSLHGDNWIHS